LLNGLTHSINSGLHQEVSSVHRIFHFILTWPSEPNQVVEKYELKILLCRSKGTENNINYQHFLETNFQFLM
jgi:hypothetical protein